jgi:hypothetical protein
LSSARRFYPAAVILAFLSRAGRRLEKLSSDHADPASAASHNRSLRAVFDDPGNAGK